MSNPKCTKLSIETPVEFLQGDAKNPGGFEIKAYTGAMIERWWGSLAINLDGLTARSNLPIFRDHDPSKIVGFSKNTWVDGSFFVSGEFSSVTEHAKEVQSLAAEGFPWQASIGVRPLKIESLERGVESVVNGQIVTGPADIWMESEVFETSFVPLGADNNTSVATFSAFEEISPDENFNLHNEVKRMDITLKKLEQEAPELLSQIKATAKADGLSEGARLERERIKAVSEQSLAGHEAMIETLMYDGKTTGPEAAVQVLAAEKLVHANFKEDLSADGINPVNNPPAPEIETKEDLSDLPTEERAKKEWDKSASLRSEFGNDFDVYLAYCEADAIGAFKILHGKEGK